MTGHLRFPPIPNSPTPSGTFAFRKSLALGLSQPVHAGDVQYRPLCGGIIALALVAGLDVAATMVMTATTALHVPWPDIAFRSLAAALIAALVFAHARNFSAIKASFTFGVICGIVPSLLIAAHHEIDHWDDFMTWLGNALYIWKFGAFPITAAPPVASVWQRVARLMVPKLELYASRWVQFHRAYADEENTKTNENCPDCSSDGKRAT